MIWLTLKISSSKIKLLINRYLIHRQILFHLPQEVINIIGVARKKDSELQAFLTISASDRIAVLCLPAISDERKALMS